MMKKIETKLNTDQNKSSKKYNKSSKNKNDYVPSDSRENISEDHLAEFVDKKTINLEKYDKTKKFFKKS